MTTNQDDLKAAAEEELALAAGLGWARLSACTPWSDTFEGFTPGGRDVCIERSYLWENEPGGDIRVEVTVYRETAYEQGVRLMRLIAPGAA